MRNIGIDFKSELDKTTHDYVVNGNLTIDVKTKDRTCAPYLEFDNTAPLYNHEHQRPDYYLFISLERRKSKDFDLKNFHTAHVVGGISCDEFDRLAIKFHEGEKDPRNGTEFWTDCLNVEMWQLISTGEIANIFKGNQESALEEADFNHKRINELRPLMDRNKIRARPLPPYKYYAHTIATYVLSQLT